MTLRILSVIVLGMMTAACAASAPDPAGKITASSNGDYNDRFGPDKTLDGVVVPRNYWAGKPGLKQWTLTYDLGKSRKLVGLAAAMFDGSGSYSHTPKTTTIAVSADGKAWTDLGAAPAPGEWTGAFYRLVTVKLSNEARYVRLTLSPARTGKQPAINEVQFLIAGKDAKPLVLGGGKPIADLARAAAPKPGGVKDDDVIATEVFEYVGSFDGLKPLKALIAYPKKGKALPLVVCMHGYSETAGLYIRRNAYLAREGWFVACVEMRGRGGSAGKHDSGGMEIHDIYDAVEALKAKFGDRIDPKRTVVQGWSGGGGNVYSCMVKLPDTFNAGAAFFGIANYARWQEILDAGNSKYPGPAYRMGATVKEAPDRYVARDAALAAKNNPYSRFFIFSDEKEPTCLPDMDRRFKKFADAAGLTNVTLTITKPGDKNHYRHGGRWDLPTTNARFLTPVKEGKFPTIEIADAGELVVLGFVVTKKFALYAGDGQDAAADVSYAIKGGVVSFTSKVRTSNPARPLTIRLPKARYAKAPAATIDGKAAKVTETPTHFVVVSPSLNGRVEITVTAKAKAKAKRD